MTATIGPVEVGNIWIPSRVVAGLKPGDAVQVVALYTLIVKYRVAADRPIVWAIKAATVGLIIYLLMYLNHSQLVEPFDGLGRLYGLTALASTCLGLAMVGFLIVGFTFVFLYPSNTAVAEKTWKELHEKAQSKDGPRLLAYIRDTESRSEYPKVINKLFREINEV